MPPVFAPGVWAGVNDGFLIARQKEQEQQRLAESRQRMSQGQTEFENLQADRARQMAARRNAGQALYGLAPPMPGTPSTPPQQPPQGPPQGPPGGGQPPGPPQMAPGVPQFSAPPGGQGAPMPYAGPPGGGPGAPMPYSGPQGGPPGVPQGGPPGMRGAPTQPDPRMLEIQRAQGDLQALDRELSRPGLNDEQRSIITGEKVKTQERLAQLTGQPAPYRSMPTGGAPSGPPQGQGGPMAPPPVGGQPQGQQPNLLMQIVSQAKAGGVPADGLMDVVDTLSPVLKNQLSEEMAALRGTQIANTAEFKMMAMRLQELEHERKMERDKTLGQQGDRKLDLSQQRIDAAAKKAESSGGAGEELTPGGLRVAAELTRAGQTIPGGWSQKGISRGNAILNILAKEEEGGAGSGAVATGRADAKAASGGYNQITKDLAAIRPYKAMLDKNADIAIDLGRKVQLSNSVWANKPIQWLKKNGSSDPNLREYLAQIAIVQTEAARVLNNPRLVGQLTDSARHEMQEIIDGKMPLADTERVLNRMKQDGDNRVKAMEDESKGLRSRTTGTGGKQPAADAASTNAKGWKLHVDGKGNKAYVSPDGKQFEEVQ